MKRTLLLILLSVTTTAFSQTNYEVFGINESFGITEYATGKEFITPVYPKYKNFFDNYIDFETETEFILYSRANGEKLVYTKGQNNMFYVRQKKVTYVGYEANYHIIENNRSVIINGEGVQESLPRKYNKIEGQKDFLFAFTDKYIDIYIYNDLHTPKVTISASKSIKDKIGRLKTEGYENFHVFYNKSAIYVYNDSLELVKTYKQGGENETDIYKIIQEDFVRRGSNSQYSDSDEYWKVTKEGNYTLFNLDEHIIFKVKGDFGLKNNYWKSISIENLTTKNSYFFYIDNEKKNFSLPKKYQEKLALQFVE